MPYTPTQLLTSVEGPKQARRSTRPRPAEPRRVPLPDVLWLVFFATLAGYVLGSVFTAP